MFANIPNAGAGPSGQTNPQPTYHYLDNNNNVASSSTPVTTTVIASTDGTKTASVVTDSSGTILSGPGTGGNYDTSTGVFTPASSATATTGSASTSYGAGSVAATSALGGPLFPILLVAGLAIGYVVLKGG